MKANLLDKVLKRNKIRAVVIWLLVQWHCNESIIVEVNGKKLAITMDSRTVMDLSLERRIPISELRF